MALVDSCTSNISFMESGFVISLSLRISFLRKISVWRVLPVDLLLISYDKYP